MVKGRTGFRCQVSGLSAVAGRGVVSLIDKKTNEH